MKKLIICMLLISKLFSVDFVPAQTDGAWNYLFDKYTTQGINGAGIKSENIATPQFVVGEEILNTFLYALPESTNASTAHPEYFPATEPEILIKENAEAFVTFYSEGAGYRNTLGFYTYEGDTGREKPTSIEQLQSHGVIIFPNTSLLHSGGELTYGTSVSLGQLSAGTKVAFFIVSNGWRGDKVQYSDWIFSTLSSLNLEYDEESTKEVPDHKHVALLWSNVGAGNILLMGFEDILRTHYGCDHDFNDALFSFSTDPMEALSDSNGSFVTAPLEQDSDNDGVSDAFDEFINDAQRAYTTHYPSINDTVSILFEDMWPKEGDYDMNDLSVELHIAEVKDSENLVKEILLSSKLKANGAAYKNGFAIQIDTPIENIESATFYVNSQESSTNVISNDNGTSIVTFFTDAVKEFKKMDDYSTFASSSNTNANCNDPYNRFINVCDNRPIVSSPEFNVTIVLKEPVNLSSPPYNPFLIVNNGVRNYNEVHLPNHMPTSRANVNLFNTHNDASDLNSSLTYKTKRDKPWGLLIPTSFSYPLERKNINTVYRHYNDWVQSNGANYYDWYLHNNLDDEGESYAHPNRIFNVSD